MALSSPLKPAIACKKSASRIIWLPGKHSNLMSSFNKAGDDIIDAEILRPKVLRNHEDTQT